MAKGRGWPELDAKLTLHWNLEKMVSCLPTLETNSMAVQLVKPYPCVSRVFMKMALKHEL